MNSNMYRRKASSFRGVYRCGKKWKSQIQIDGVQYYLGVFPTEDRAAEEYRIAAKRLGKSDETDYCVASLFKEYADGDTEAEFNVPPNQNLPSSSSSSSVVAPPYQPSGLGDNFNRSTSYRTTPSRFSVGPSPSITTRFSPEANAEDDIRTTSFYLIPTNHLSLISSKVKLGKLGEEILALSRICEENSELKVEGGMTSDEVKLAELRNAIFQSLQHIRNGGSTTQIQAKHKHAELTDDETMYEV
jgi:hypothetical protein